MKPLFQNEVEYPQSYPRPYGLAGLVTVNSSCETALARSCNGLAVAGPFKNIMISAGNSLQTWLSATGNCNLHSAPPVSSCNFTLP